MAPGTSATAASAASAASAGMPTTDAAAPSHVVVRARFGVASTVAGPGAAVRQISTCAVMRTEGICIWHMGQEV